MSAITVKLLQAASEIAGGNRALADRLGIGEALLSRFMDDRHELPDPLLLRAVDIILADRETRPSPRAGLLPEEPKSPQNGGRGSGATFGTGSA